MHVDNHQSGFTETGLACGQTDFKSVDPGSAPDLNNIVQIS